MLCRALSDCRKSVSRMWYTFSPPLGQERPSMRPELLTLHSRTDVHGRDRIYSIMPIVERDRERASSDGVGKREKVNKFPHSDRRN